MAIAACTTVVYRLLSTIFISSTGNCKLVLDVIIVEHISPGILINQFVKYMHEEEHFKVEDAMGAKEAKLQGVCHLHPIP